MRPLIGVCTVRVRPRPAFFVHRIGPRRYEYPIPERDNVTRELRVGRSVFLKPKRVKNTKAPVRSWVVVWFARRFHTAEVIFFLQRATTSGKGRTPLLAIKFSPAPIETTKPPPPPAAAYASASSQSGQPAVQPGLNQPGAPAFRARSQPVRYGRTPGRIN